MMFEMALTYPLESTTTQQVFIGGSKIIFTSIFVQPPVAKTSKNGTFILALILFTMVASTSVNYFSEFVNQSKNRIYLRPH